jgi:hypothetical protein
MKKRYLKKKKTLKGWPEVEADSQPPTDEQKNKKQTPVISAEHRLNWMQPRKKCDSVRGH